MCPSEKHIFTRALNFEVPIIRTAIFYRVKIQMLLRASINPAAVVERVIVRPNIARDAPFEALFTKHTAAAEVVSK